MNIPEKDRLGALVSLYSTERADLTSIGNQNIAIVGLALTYIVAVFFGLAQTAEEKSSSIFWLAAPIPLLVFMAFYTLYISLARARTEACKFLENEIMELTHLAPDMIGVTVSDKIMDINAAARRQKGVILAAYIPIFLAIIVLTVYVVIRAFRHHTHLWAIIIAIILYMLLLAPTGVAWAKELNNLLGAGGNCGRSTSRRPQNVQFGTAGGPAR
jgi:hypothetical protein